VSLFGPKEPCPHCGQKVKKPDDPADFLCNHCGKPGPWATDAQVATWTTQQGARARYEALLAKLETTPLSTDEQNEMASVRAVTAYNAEELQDVHVAALQRAATDAVSDDLLTPEENARLQSLMSGLSVRWEQLRAVNPTLSDRVFVSAINGGQLPEVPSPHIIATKGEIVHYECTASLMREVAVRQYQGGYQGFSFPIGKDRGQVSRWRITGSQRAGWDAASSR
jgi:hypothetical protein